MLRRAPSTLRPGRSAPVALRGVRWVSGYHACAFSRARPDPPKRHPAPRHRHLAPVQRAWFGALRYVPSLLSREHHPRRGSACRTTDAGGDRGAVWPCGALGCGITLPMAGRQGEGDGPTRGEGRARCLMHGHTSRSPPPLCLPVYRFDLNPGTCLHVSNPPATELYPCPQTSQ